MKKIFRILGILLCAACILGFAVDASAGTKKVTAATAREKAKTIKKGKTTVTVGDPTKTKTNNGYVKFKSTKTKTYKITVGNVRRQGKKSSNDIISTSVNFYTPTSTGGFKNIEVKQNGKKVYTLSLCSAKSWSISQKYGKEKTTAYTSLKSRTASIKIKKGQTVIILLSNINRFKQSFDVTIK